VATYSAEQIQAVVDQLKAGTVTLGQLETQYGMSASEIQSNLDAINSGQVQVADSWTAPAANDTLNLSTNPLNEITVSDNPLNDNPLNYAGAFDYSPSQIPTQTSSVVEEAEPTPGELVGTASTAYNTLNNVSSVIDGANAFAAGGDAAAAGLADYTGGLSSIVGTLSGQESTAETAILTALGMNPATAPFVLAYRLFDAMNLFGGGGMEETPMTAEEKATFNVTQKIRDYVMNGGAGEDGTEGAGDEAALAELMDQAVRAGTGNVGELVDKVKAAAGGTDGYWQDPETGQALPDFNPETGEGMGTLFPRWVPSDDAGGGGSSAASAAEAEAGAAEAEAGSAAAAQAEAEAAAAENGGGNTGAVEGAWVYDSEAGLFRQVGGIETVVPKPGTYTEGQIVDNAEMRDVFEGWGDNSADNPSYTPEQIDQVVEDIANGKTIAELAIEYGIPSIIIQAHLEQYKADKEAARAAGSLSDTTINGDTSNAADTPTQDGTGTNGNGTGTNGNGTGTNGNGTGTNGNGTVTTVTGTNGTDTTNTGGNGGGTGTGTGDGDGAGDGFGDGRLGLFQNNTTREPTITEQVFTPELFQLDNVPTGMFQISRRFRDIL
jgi:hypothetical protein